GAAGSGAGRRRLWQRPRLSRWTGETHVAVCRRGAIYDDGVAAGLGAHGTQGSQRYRTAAQTATAGPKTSAPFGEGTGLVFECIRFASGKLARRYAWHDAFS